MTRIARAAYFGIIWVVIFSAGVFGFHARLWVSALFATAFVALCLAEDWRLSHATRCPTCGREY